MVIHGMNIIPMLLKQHHPDFRPVTKIQFAVTAFFVWWHEHLSILDFESLVGE
jgi:hypothetical protein